MKKFLMIAVLIMIVVTGCSNQAIDNEEAPDVATVSTEEIMTENYQGFQMDNDLKTEDLGDIHYNLLIPKDYDAGQKYALHMALPGWEGLYFQGVGEDLRWEYLPHESGRYAQDMIVASLQLDDWGENSALQTVRLTEYLMEEYSIDRERVLITGYSAGGETLSRVMEFKPELYRKALFVSSKWGGDPKPMTKAHTALYLFTSEHDSYYGAEPAREAWQSIHDLYLEQGLSEDEISELLVLDVREDGWFDHMMEEHTDRTKTQYATDYHGAGMLVAFDETVMNWVFK